jgi:hypothetical protein
MSDDLDKPRNVRAVRAMPAFIEHIRRGFVARSVSADVASLTEAEADHALLLALARKLTRAAQAPGARVGAMDIVSLYPGEDLLVIRVGQGMAVGFAMSTDAHRSKP